MQAVSKWPALAALLVATAGCAQGPMGMGPQARGPRAGPDHTPGWMMMGPAEREEHHRRLQAARTPEECRRIMDEHRKLVTERASGRGMAMQAPPQDACAPMMK